VAIARWGEDALLNPYGELFSPPPASFPAGLPELHGPAGQQRSLIERFIEVGKLLKTAGLRPRALIEDERRAWRLTLDNGVEMLLGREESLARLARFVAVYPQTLERRVDALQRVDLRYTNGFAVAWRAETQPAAQQEKGMRRDVQED
jgi:cell division protein FtsQ